MDNVFFNEILKKFLNQIKFSTTNTVMYGIYGYFTIIIIYFYFLYTLQ